MVIVYTKTRCVQCDATKRALKAKNIAFTEVNLETDAEAFAKVTSLGYREAPVVDYNGKIWSGFQPDEISKIV